jgi:hypothetical protein
MMLPVPAVIAHDFESTLRQGMLVIILLPVVASPWTLTVPLSFAWALRAQCLRFPSYTRFCGLTQT